MLNRSVVVRMSSDKVQNLLEQLNSSRNYTITRQIYEIPVGREMKLLECFVKRGESGDRVVVCLIDGSEIAFPDYGSGGNFHILISPGFSDLTFFQYLKELMELDGETFLTLKETKSRHFNNNIPVWHFSHTPNPESLAV